MNIKFSGNHSIDGESGNIIFFAEVDGKTVPCIVSDQALQDLLPSNAKKKPDELFKLYKADLENIAEKKISAPEFNWGDVLITTVDMP
jgi:hypothetical protein